MKKIISIIILFFTCAISLSAGPLILDDNNSGNVYLYSEDQETTHDLSFYNQNNNSYPRISQIGTSLSVFTTGVMHLSGYDSESFAKDFKNFTYYHRSENSQQVAIYPINILMVMGAFGASLCNYKFGFENDILTLMPVFPVVITYGNENSFGYREAKEYRLQYGLYFYFSRDF